jgi:TolA-binding protein
MRVKSNPSISTIFIVLLLFFGLHFLITNAAGDILSDRQEIESLIEAGKLTGAQTQIERLKADYSRDPQLPEALYGIARKYRWKHKWEQANNLYNQIIQNHPDSLSASRANLGIARIEVLSRLVDRDYDGAQQALDELVADFKGHPDLPESLCNIAEGFRWGHKWERARNLYKQIKQDYPDTSHASKAELAIANLEVVSSLVAKNYTAARKSLEEMINNFPDHPDMPATLYYIAEGFRWAQKWEQAQDLYQKIIQGYPDSSYADRARLGQSKVEVLSLIVSRKFDSAEEALDKLIADFSGHPDLPDTLYWRISMGE